MWFEWFQGDSLVYFESLQGSTYLIEALLWKVILLQPYFGWITMKIYFSELLETNLISETVVSQTQPAFICSKSAIITVE